MTLPPSGRLYADAYGVPDRMPQSLPIYALCLVWVAGKDADLEAAIATSRAALGLRREYEFHARKLTKGERSSHLPARFFEQLLQQPVVFSASCAVMVKQRSRLPLDLKGSALTHELTRQAVLRMPSDQVAAHTLTIDGEKSGKKVSAVARTLRAEVNSALAHADRQERLARVVAKSADTCAGLQLADMIAAAIVTPWSDCLRLLGDTVQSWRT